MKRRVPWVAPHPSTCPGPPQKLWSLAVCEAWAQDTFYLGRHLDSKTCLPWAPTLTYPQGIGNTEHRVRSL